MLSRLPDHHAGGRAVAVYTLLRAVLLLGTAAVAYLAGFRGLLLLIVALLASGIASWFLLRGPRSRVGEAIESRLQRARQRTAAEDEYVDALMADPGVTRPDR